MDYGREKRGERGARVNFIPIVHYTYNLLTRTVGLYDTYLTTRTLPYYVSVRVQGTWWDYIMELMMDK